MLGQPDAARRARLFIVAIAVCLATAAAVVVVAAGGSAVGQRPADDPLRVAAVRSQPHVFLRHAQSGDRFGRVSIASLAAPDSEPALTALNCARFYFAGGRGVCLSARSGLLFIDYRAEFVDSDLNVVASLPLAGVPSRARISPDGRYAAMTVFVTGHSYAGSSFSTQTLIADAATGTGIADLEDFPVVRDGQRFREPGFNFWGVTFTSDSNVFYATLGVRGRTYLVRGDLAERRFEVLAQNVECPSLSPDGTRVAFKRRVSGGDTTPIEWRLHVLDLADISITPLGREERNVDDQLEWLDDDHVLYAVQDPQTSETNLWRTAVADGVPELYVASVDSPAVAAFD